MMLLRLFLLLSAVNCSSVIVGMDAASESHFAVYAKDHLVTIKGAKSGILCIGLREDDAINSCTQARAAICKYKERAEAQKLEDTENFLKTLEHQHSNWVVTDVADIKKVHIRSIPEHGLYFYAFGQDLKTSLAIFKRGETGTVTNPRLILFGTIEYNKDTIKIMVGAITKDNPNPDPEKFNNLGHGCIIFPSDSPEKAKVITSSNQHWLKTWSRAHPCFTYLSLLGLFSFGFATFLYMKHKQ